MTPTDYITCLRKLDGLEFIKTLKKAVVLFDETDKEKQFNQDLNILLMEQKVKGRDGKNYFFHKLLQPLMTARLKRLNNTDEDEIIEEINEIVDSDGLATKQKDRIKEEMSRINSLDAKQYANFFVENQESDSDDSDDESDNESTSVSSNKRKRKAETPKSTSSFNGETISVSYKDQHTGMDIIDVRNLTLIEWLNKMSEYKCYDVWNKVYNNNSNKTKTVKTSKSYMRSLILVLETASKLQLPGAILLTAISNLKIQDFVNMFLKSYEINPDQHIGMDLINRKVSMSARDFVETYISNSQQGTPPGLLKCGSAITCIIMFYLSLMTDKKAEDMLFEMANNMNDELEELMKMDTAQDDGPIITHEEKKLRIE